MNTTTTTTEPYIKSVIQNKAMHMAGSELCANTRAAVTAHVAQDSRTAHQMALDDLYKIKAKVHEIIDKNDPIIRANWYNAVIPLIDKLISKHQ